MGHFVIRVRAAPSSASDGSRAVALDMLDTSSNGTWVNGLRVGKGQRVPLAVGDRITVLPAAQVGRASTVAYMLLHDTRGACCRGSSGETIASSPSCENAA